MHAVAQLTDVLQDNGIAQDEMTECPTMRMHLLKQSCADMWRSGNQEVWKPGTAKTHPQCNGCEQGAELAKQMKPKKRKLKAPGEGLMEERQKMGKKEYLCKACGKNSAILNSETWKPLSHGLCRECLSLFLKRSAEAKKENIKEEKKPLEKKQEKNIEARPALTLDFTEHQDILDKLTEDAKVNIRPVHMQALWLLKQKLEAKDAPEIPDNK